MERFRRRRDRLDVSLSPEIDQTRRLAEAVTVPVVGQKAAMDSKVVFMLRQSSKSMGETMYLSWFSSSSTIRRAR